MACSVIFHPLQKVFRMLQIYDRFFYSNHKQSIFIYNVRRCSYNTAATFFLFTSIVKQTFITAYLLRAMQELLIRTCWILIDHFNSTLYWLDCGCNSLERNSQHFFCRGTYFVTVLLKTVVFKYLSVFLLPDTSDFYFIHFKRNISTFSSLHFKITTFLYSHIFAIKYRK